MHGVIHQGKVVFETTLKVLNLTGIIFRDFHDF